MSLPVSAELKDEYCLTQTGQRLKEAVIETADHSVKPVTLDFTAAGKSYRLIVDTSTHALGLFNEQNQKISEVSILQFEEQDIDKDNAIIFELALSKKGWLWVDGFSNDYIAHIDLNSVPPTISEPVELSKFTNTECLPLAWLGNCRNTQGIYSHALESILVSSTKRSFWGLFPPVKLIIKDGKIRPLPKELDNVLSEQIKVGSQQLHFSDLPVLNGVIFREASDREEFAYDFRGTPGKALFYDGKVVTSILEKSGYGENTRWNIETASTSKHIILVVHSDKEHIHFEVNPDLSLRRLTLLDNVTDDVSRIGEFWLGKHGVYVKEENKLHPIINVSPQVNLWKYEYIEKTPSKKIIVFEAINYVTNKSADYSIVPISTTSHCISKLDPNNPIMLDTAK